MAPRPYTLIAELTYRCPLACPYCSNPLDLGKGDLGKGLSELTTDAWGRVFAEAEELGVMQVHLTGGEPLARKDVTELVARAHTLSLYVNLITSGVPLTRKKLLELKAAGLDNVQLSFQDADRASADKIAGYEAHDAKLEVARWVKELGLPLTVNVVLHRANIGNVPAIIDLGERLSADRLELASAQYAGWALGNRDALLPGKEALARARADAEAARARLKGKTEVVYVVPDYYAAFPKACMDGWASRYVHVSPDGAVLPCHAAKSIQGMTFENVADKPLGAIWESSPALERFRGDAWMPDPCRSCERKALDFGGCRCQAFLLAGDAAKTDPACPLSPDHGLVRVARDRAERDEIRYLYRGR